MSLKRRGDSPDLHAVKIYKGLSVYKVRGSQFWYLRLWNHERRKYIVSGTGQTSEIGARRAAIDFAVSRTRSQEPVEREFTFRHFANKTLVHCSRRVGEGRLHRGTMKAIEWAIQNADWGLLKWFGAKDVRKISNRDYTEYINDLTQRRPDLSSSSKNSIMSAFRNVLKLAHEENAIPHLPATPRAKLKDNPRPFFRFHPLVDKQNDSYRKLLRTAREMAEAKIVIRGIPVTDELHDILVFLTQSFVRPLTSELYAIKHNDISRVGVANGLACVADAVGCMADGFTNNLLLPPWNAKAERQVLCCKQSNNFAKGLPPKIVNS
jgi:hypothetical protein